MIRPPEQFVWCLRNAQCWAAIAEPCNRTALLISFFGLSCAGVAQLVEHLICNQRVGGSNPSASWDFMIGADLRIQKRQAVSCVNNSGERVSLADGDRTFDLDGGFPVR